MSGFFRKFKISLVDGSVEIQPKLTSASIEDIKNLYIGNKYQTPSGELKTVENIEEIIK